MRTISAASGAAFLLLATGAATAVAAPHRDTAPARSRPAASAPPAPGWTPTQCGREPVAPSVDTSTVQRYNGSVDQVTAYDQAARAYDNCVSRQATAEQTAISDAARARIDAIQAVSAAVRRRIADNFSALSEQLRRGVPKTGAR